MNRSSPLRSLGRVTLVSAIAAFGAATALADAPRGHYELRDASVLDRRTRLEWARRPTIADPVSLSDALLACNNLPGGSWRVPSARELETIVDVRASSAPAWDKVAFGEGTPAPPIFWSLTPLVVAAPPLTHVVVDFRPMREVAALASTDLAYVRCVRSAP